MPIRLIKKIMITILIIILIPLLGILINITLNYGRLVGTFGRKINCTLVSKRDYSLFLL